MALANQISVSVKAVAPQKKKNEVGHVKVLKNEIEEFK